MKVLPFKIPKPFDSTLVVQEDKARIFYNQLHQHAEVQISYIVQGQGKLIVANSVYSFEAGDIYVIGSNIPHLFQSIPTKELSHMITLFVTEESFGNDFFQIPELEDVKKFFRTSEGGIRVLSKKKSIRRILLELPTVDKLQAFIRFLKLVQKINGATIGELTTFVPSKKIISNNEGRRLQLVFDYAMNHFDKEIKLNYVASLVHMTTPAFCRFFKQRTNKTFFEFLIELRLEHACQLLSGNEKLSIAEISEASGFQSISNFNRKFKKNKMASPSQYAKKMRPEPTH
ncbi:AraC family transcriptional regulator [Maribacter halichondriae]|uniref:AraC family transcriptional regulator n=1 Tax=Maribacter halichondriae TaxID=2980554 RepID=UPI0023595FCF|nr:AraC family transcriptional regulator [Maribacter sp. Hal144]